MELKKLSLIFLESLILMIILDFIFLGLIMNNYIQSELGNLLRFNTNYYTAILVYAALSLAIIFFIVLNHTINNHKKALYFGLILGFSIYSVYELTNYSTIQGWSLNFVFIDIIWGTILIGLLSLLAFHISEKLKVNSYA